MGVPAPTQYSILEQRLTYNPPVDMQTNDFWSVYNRVQDQWNPKIQVQRNLIIEKSTGSSEKKYKCEKCDRSYITLAHFIRHQRLEAQKDPILKCDLCNYRSRVRSSLFRHVHSKHSKIKLGRKYECDRCKRNYNW